MSSNQTLMALDIVRDDFFLPAAVTELPKRNEFNKRLIHAMRHNLYLIDVLRLVNIDNSNGCDGVDVFDQRVASSTDSGDEETETYAFEERIDKISEMTRDEKCEIIPFLRHLGLWVLLHDDETNRLHRLPFTLYFKEASSPYSRGTYLAPTK